MEVDTKLAWAWNGWDASGPKLVEVLVVDGKHHVVGDGYVTQTRTWETREDCLAHFLKDAQDSARRAQERVGRIQALLIKERRVD